jgi:hypothetical protein
MTLGASGVLIGRRGRRRWLGRLAFAFALILFVPAVDFVGLVGTLVWVPAATALNFAIRPSATAAPALA